MTKSGTYTHHQRLGLRPPPLGLWVSGFGFRVPGSGFRAWVQVTGHDVADRLSIVNFCKGRKGLQHDLGLVFGFKPSTLPV